MRCVRSPIFQSCNFSFFVAALFYATTVLMSIDCAQDLLFRELFNRFYLLLPAKSIFCFFLWFPFCSPICLVELLYSLLVFGIH